jgi:hypothetical protein
MNGNASGEQKTPWYFRTSVLVFIFLCIGPLALPLLWINPRYSKKAKVGVTIIVVILSYVLWVATASSLKYLNDYLEALGFSRIW